MMFDIFFNFGIIDSLSLFRTIVLCISFYLLKFI